MTSSKSRIISWTINGETFESKGTLEIWHKPGTVMSAPLTGDPITRETFDELSRDAKAMSEFAGFLGFIAARQWPGGHGGE